jgi:uncharacterized membrane protein YgdD (TMEM256/DUF423 family)
VALGNVVVTNAVGAIAARVFLFLGAINALLAILAGAYAAHGLSGEHAVSLFQTAIQYQMFHALGLLAVGMLLTQRRSWLLVWSGGVMLFGILAFCGGLYAAALTGAPAGIAPAGGTALMLAWLLFAIGVLRR